MSYLSRFVLLALGVGVTTLGLLYWQHRDFGFEGIWFHDENGFHLHPLHLVALGLAIVPPTIWEIFLLELVHRVDSTRDTTPDSPDAATKAGSAGRARAAIRGWWSRTRPAQP